MDWIVSPLNSLSPYPQFFRTWLYLETGPLKRWITYNVLLAESGYMIAHLLGNHGFWPIISNGGAGGESAITTSTWWQWHTQMEISGKQLEKSIRGQILIGEVLWEEGCGWQPARTEAERRKRGQTQLWKPRLFQRLPEEEKLQCNSWEPDSGFKWTLMGIPVLLLSSSVTWGEVPFITQSLTLLSVKWKH